MSATKKVSIWMALTLSIGLSGLTAGMNSIVPGPSSKAAFLRNHGEKLAIEHGLTPYDGLILIVSPVADTQASDTEMVLKKVSEDLKATRSPITAEPLFILVQHAYNTSLIDENQFISPDQRYYLVAAQGRSAVYESAKEYQTIIPLVNDWSTRFPNHKFNYLSNATGESEVLDMIARDLDKSLIFSIPLTLLILIWGFRSFTAACVPLLIAGFSLIASLGISAWVSHLFGPISATASQLVVLLVLAIGVDYSLFFITRVREEFKERLNVVASIQETQRTTGSAILWSGLIVAISLLGLLLMEDTVLTSMALVSIISVLVTLASCLFVLPQILQILPRVLINRKDDATLPPKRSRSMQVVLSHPLASATLVVTILALLSAFTAIMHLGNTMTPSILPQTLPGMRSYALLKRHFPHMTGGDISLILASGKLSEVEENGRLDEAFNKIRALGLRGPTRVEISDDYFVHRYKFLLDGTGNEPETALLVERLENKELNTIFAPLEVQAHLAGIVPYSINQSAKYWRKMPLVFSVVLILSFVFLLLAFRSIVIPIKAIVLNLLSTGASFGILVLLFQYIPQSPVYFGVIESFVPPLLFTILFGLSMDYHVFMLARITEEYRKSLNTRHAVEIGIRETSKTITSAALIMISVFLIAATLELPVMKQLGFGLGAAILIDATLVRTILLPSTVILLGKHNWWLPRWLSFLPKIEMS